MDWKKLGYAAVAAALSFAVLWALGGLLSLLVLRAVAAFAVGWLVYVKVAGWEIQRALDEAKRLGGKLGG